uniref:Winged helix Storkhead-box1 domain-containing protein n=1 Tax=Timema genevievae TaxID=629358 RepID=A0A7R9JSI0_TIMGE|nr:unnamed protein product [Timema genevievae]
MMTHSKVKQSNAFTRSAARIGTGYSTIETRGPTYSELEATLFNDKSLWEIKNRSLLRATGNAVAVAGMSGRSPGGKGPPGSRCILLVQRCLAIQLHKVGLGNDHKKGKPSEQIGTPARNHINTEFWMYDSGYLLFQGFLEANMKCFWNLSLLEAMRVLEFQGYVSPGVLLVTASACALEVIRAAWARNVLRPPNNYVIAVVALSYKLHCYFIMKPSRLSLLVKAEFHHERKKSKEALLRSVTAIVRDIEDCLMQPLTQGQFTPLPEALCWVILDLTSSGQAAVTDKICSALQSTFTDMESPSHEVVYDALAKLTQERKVYQTSRGYFVVTPEKRRRDSHSNRHRRHSRSGNPTSSLSMSATRGEESQHRSRLLLMSTDEAMALVHGEMQTIRDGEITHQAVQTNLADVICGEKTSLLSRLFRRSGRKRGLSAPPAPLVTFSAQFPPTEWFNPLEDNALKSREGGLSHGLGSADLCPYTSLSDLTVHFKSLAAQKILKGVSINSIDTLVEVNMAAAEKQNNCDVTIHTDLGMTKIANSDSIIEKFLLCLRV